MVGVLGAGCDGWWLHGKVRRFAVQGRVTILQGKLQYHKKPSPGTREVTELLQHTLRCKGGAMRVAEREGEVSKGGTAETRCQAHWKIAGYPRWGRGSNSMGSNGNHQ